MAEYSKEEIQRIEEKWRTRWEELNLYKVNVDHSKPKYYVLDMFPYPSGAGLHVGHPLGYIASDIVSRYKRLRGYNVLHPMGFDSFGLPAEQYAIQTGQHPRITTERNIETYKRQLGRLGFCFDWSREVQTSDPQYYKWTQWIFMQLFNAWYNRRSTVHGVSHTDGAAEPIGTLIAAFKTNGNKNIDAACDDDTPVFSADDWNGWDERKKENILQKYRIAYLSETMVNWCSALGTVLSNDEVKDGVSERGGHPVERIKMWQWSMRISAFAERLLKGLDTIDWPEPVSEMQRNWIGKSTGCELDFPIDGFEESIKVFTTRIDTIFGVTFMVLAPEHELVRDITTEAQRQEVEAYVEVASNRSERERLSEVKRVTGVFTGAYAINPLNKERVPIWVADYVLAGYGTGAVMAVPGSDTRDYAFAKHFGLPVVEVMEGPGSDISQPDFDPKAGTMINSSFLNGLNWKEAVDRALDHVEALGLGKRKVNYRIRDAIFGRQRYWGEPFPVYYKDEMPHLVKEEDLPVTLPEIDEYKPTETGEPPLARAKEWRYRPGLTPGPSPKERGTATNEGERMYETSEKKYWHILKQYAKENRTEPTSSESTLWEALRNHKLGHKIRRQHAIGIFIADFACVPKRLVIEVDGEYHASAKEYDAARRHFLEFNGYTVIRFTNEEVLTNLQDVVKRIKEKLDSLPTEGTPSPLERGPGGEAYPFELTTMPGWAGSSWYWFRYMDPQNSEAFCSKEAESYWKDVDLYIGGSEHATGHLLYSRFWCKALRDLGYVSQEEPFKKMINQGHIQGVSAFVLSVSGFSSNYHLEYPLIFVSKNVIQRCVKENDTSIFLPVLKRHNPTLDFSKVEVSFSSATPNNGIISRNIPIDLVSQEDSLDIEGFLKWRRIWAGDEGSIEFILEENGKFICPREIEKMSKSKFNVVNPDDIVNAYGADTLRMYEMFLGPLELSKPWNTNGIDGVYKFLRKFWNLFHNTQGDFVVSDEAANADELKVLHRTIRKVQEDIERFSFNTSVSEFMICANELTALKCNKRTVLEPLVIVLAPFAPHIADELWEKLGHNTPVLTASFPVYDEKYLVQSSFDYPISINGKVRSKMNFPLDMAANEIEREVLASEVVQKWSEGKKPKKVIVVQGRIVNVVL